MNIQFVVAEKSDIEAVLPLLSQQLSEHNIDIRSNELSDAVAGIISDSRVGLIAAAYLGKDCIGVAYLSFIWALEHGGKSGWLEELFVDPSHRGKGLGSRLLLFVMEQARERGCRAIDLEIDSSHERVRSLYSRHLFYELSRSRMAVKL
jgi:GNAT superfamily N-acetyltransferase